MHKIIIITNTASATTIVIKIAYSAPTMFQVLHKNRCHLLFPVTLWIHVMDGTMIVSWTGQFKVTSIRKKKKMFLGSKRFEETQLKVRISKEKNKQSERAPGSRGTVEANSTSAHTGIVLGGRLWIFLCPWPCCPWCLEIDVSLNSSCSNYIFISWPSYYNWVSPCVFQYVCVCVWVRENGFVFLLCKECYKLIVINLIDF